jgi:hypothetical protein
MTRSTFRPLVAMTYPVAQDHRVNPTATTIIRPFPDDVTTWASGHLHDGLNAFRLVSR